MVHFPKLCPSCHPITTPSTPVLPPNSQPVTEAYTRREILKIKVAEIWNQFFILLHLRPKLSVTQRIQEQINLVNDAAAQNNKPLLFQTLRKAFFHAMHIIEIARIDPTHPPKNVALQLTEIIGRFGIAIYASKDVKDPYQSPLDVLKTAILMQEYALGLRDSCPNLLKLDVLDNLYNKETVRAANAKLADQTIDNLNPDAWADKITTLNQQQQLLVPQILRFTNGAMRYLNYFKTEGQKDLPKSAEQIEQIKAENTVFIQRCGNLLNTAKASLKATMEVEGFDQTETKDQLAELIYNDLTGFASAQAEEYESNGQKQLAAKTKAELKVMWDQCVALSKHPLKMQARCDNKRCFIEKPSLDEELTLRTSSLEKHLSLPEDQQDPVLIAISFHNISNLFARLDRPIEALYASIAAVKLVIQCRTNGENNIQFDDIVNHANKLIETYKHIYENLEQPQV